MKSLDLKMVSFFVGALSLVQVAHSQEDAPFDDIDAAVSAPPASPKNSKAKKKAPTKKGKKSSTKTSAKKVVSPRGSTPPPASDELGDSFALDAAPAPGVASATTPDPVEKTAPAAKTKGPEKKSKPAVAKAEKADAPPSAASTELGDADLQTLDAAGIDDPLAETPKKEASKSKSETPKTAKAEKLDSADPMAAAPAIPDDGGLDLADSELDAKPTSNAKDQTPKVASKAESSADSDAQELLSDIDSKPKKAETESTDQGVRDVLTSDAKVPDADPDDMVDLEKTLKDTAVAKAPTLPKALLDSGPDPGMGLEPSDQFYRVPLRPQMSDNSWKKWAGPALTKGYRVHKKDSLWAISERLFGNPFLWPKIWQLNAQVDNPHLVDPGMELLFVPGNFNSAPIMAFTRKGDTEEVPLVESYEKLSFMEELDRTLRTQMASVHPPFQSFLLDEIPEELAKVPKPSTDARVFYAEGDEFDVADVSDGDYSLIRVNSLFGSGPKRSTFRAYRMRWLGKVRVLHGKAVVSKSFTEIEEGDLLVAKDFAISPLSLREEKLGEEESRKARLLAFDEGSNTTVSTRRMMGMRFTSEDAGPKPGAILNFVEHDHTIGKALVVHREGRMGTLYLVEATREIHEGDVIE